MEQETNTTSMYHEFQTHATPIFLFFYHTTTADEQQADDSQMEESTLHTITPEMVFGEEQAMRQEQKAAAAKSMCKAREPL